MKRLLLAFALVFAVAAVATPSDAQAQIKVGPRLGLDLGDDLQGDDTILYLGGDVRFDPPAVPIVINPTFDYYFVEDPVNFWSLSVNGLYKFGGGATMVFTPYAGAGLGIFRTSVDDQTVSLPGGGQAQVEGDGQTDFGINLIFGAEFNTGPVSPFIEANYTPVFGEDDTASLFGLRGGLLFGF